MVRLRCIHVDNNATTSGILHVLIRLLRTPAKNVLGVENAVYVAVSYSEYCLNWVNIRILVSMYK